MSCERSVKMYLHWDPLLLIYRIFQGNYIPLGRWRPLIKIKRSIKILGYCLMKSFLIVFFYWVTDSIEILSVILIVMISTRIAIVGWLLSSIQVSWTPSIRTASCCWKALILYLSVPDQNYASNQLSPNKYSTNAFHNMPDLDYASSQLGLSKYLVDVHKGMLASRAQSLAALGLGCHSWIVQGPSQSSLSRLPSSWSVV